MKKTTGSYTSYTQAVTDAKAGVQEAFTFLYESTYRDKRYIAQKYMHSEADAEDVLQDAYVKAWRNLDQLKEAEKFPGWLSLIVSSAALDALRKKKDLPFSVLEKESDEGDAFEYEEEDWRTEYQPEHAYTDRETSELLRELMDALSEEQRFCMLMYYVEEHSVAEIAEIIGCSEGTVKSRLNYGRKNLRAKAADMEKKGYTLYSIPPVALLLYLLRMEAKAASFVIPAIDTAAAAAMAKSGAAADSASGASTTAGGTTSGAAGSAASGAGGTTAGAAASGAGGAGAAAATATATAAVAAKVAGISLGVKIAAAVLAVAVIGGGGVAAIRHRQSSSVAQEQTAETVSADGVNAELLSATAGNADAEGENSQENEKVVLLAGVECVPVQCRIVYNSDMTDKSVVFCFKIGESSGYYSFTTDNLYIDLWNDFSMYYCVKDKMNRVIRFYETYELLNQVFLELYQTSIEPYRGEIDSVFLELARLSMEQRQTNLLQGTIPIVDLTEKLPNKLFMVFDGESQDLDVLKAELKLISGEKTEIEPETSMPYWKMEKGLYYRPSYIHVTYYVPEEQLLPFCTYCETLAEKEKEIEREMGLNADELTRRNNRYRNQREAESAANGETEPLNDAEQSENQETEQSEDAQQSTSSIVGTWYDPTGLSVGVYTFYEDGTGIEDLGGSTTISFKYTISGNTLSYTFKGFTHTLTISGDRLVDGYGAKYIKK